VVAAGSLGSVARAIVQRAGEVSADLICIGSHSRSPVGRFFLGSISQKVAAQAKCSVRICRPRPPSGAAPRLLVAVDGSQSSRAAVCAVAERAWPAHTAVAVVNVIEPPLRELAGLLPEDAAEIQRQHEARLHWLEEVGTAALHQLELAGLDAERHSLEGEPKSTLLEWAERWNADCLFIGASGLHHPGTETLGTVAWALAVRAHCSVEIVRAFPITPHN
jgi:nucleotide-binding universal stress UspA family protein